MKKYFLIVLTALISLPGVLAASQHSVVGDLTSFYLAFKALLGGQVDSFVPNLVHSVPLFGLFFIIFGFTFFLTKITLFKHADHDKYARMIAIGIALVGIVQQSVYDAILGWTTTFLILAFIFAIIMMSLMFVNYSRTNHHEINEKMYKNIEKNKLAKHKAKIAKHDITKLEHEMYKDKGLMHKVKRDLSSLDRDLRDVDHFTGNELSQVHQIGKLLRKATAAADRGKDKDVHGYLKSLSRDLASLITSMSHEDHDMRRTHNLLRDLHHDISYLIKDEHDEKSEDEHVKHILKTLIHKYHGHVESDVRVKRLLREEHGLHTELSKISRVLLKLRSIESELQKYADEMESYGYQKKYDAVSSCRDSVMTYKFHEAQSYLNHLKSLIERGRNRSTQIVHFEREIKQHLSELDSYEAIVKHLLEQIMHKLKKEQKELNKERREIEDVVDENEHHAED